MRKRDFALTLRKSTMVHINEKEVIYSTVFMAARTDTVHIKAPEKAPMTLRISFGSHGDGNVVSVTPDANGTVNVVISSQQTISGSGEPLHIGFRPHGAPLYLQYMETPLNKSSLVHLFLLEGKIPTAST
jgi:hypothetical protein